jgi:hypothetical protein
MFIKEKEILVGVEFDAFSDEIKEVKAVHGWFSEVLVFFDRGVGGFETIDDNT